MRFFIVVIIGLILLMTSSLSQATCQREIVVLIPGFFNIPGFKAPLNFIDYYSKTISQVVQSKNKTAIVLKTMNPIGTIEENSQKVQAELEVIVRQNPGCSLNIIAHSAGGIYMAKALTKNPQLPVKQVFTISTPYKGAELLHLITWIPGWRKILDWLDLRSLQELSPENSGKTLAALRIPQSVRWVMISAVQSPCHLISCTFARNMSWLLSAAWSFMNDIPGDGVVSIDSSLFLNGTLKTLEQQEKLVERWAVALPLEHWELVLDSSAFEILGVVDPEWVQTQQQISYEKILNEMAAP